MAQQATRGTGSSSWIVQRLNEVSKEAERWPTWVRSQPLTASDVESSESIEKPAATAPSTSEPSDKS